MEYDRAVIKYKDQKYIFDSITGNRKEYIFGHLKNGHKITYINIDQEKMDISYDERIAYYVTVLVAIYLLTSIMNIYYLKEKNVEFLEVLAHIIALFFDNKICFWSGI